MTGNSNNDEGRLVDSARSGDVGAFEALYRMYSGRVYGLCVRLTSDRAEAEDCTQETFITAWQKLPDFRGESRLMTWLHSIAYRQVIGRQRASVRQATHLSAVASDVNEADRPELGERRDLEIAISRLPERAREAFVLQKVYGYSHGEVADIMGITSGACKAQVHRALKLLAAALPQHDDESSIAANGDT